MGRPDHYPIERIQRKVWIRTLRIEAANVPPFSESRRGVTTWAKLQKELLKDYGEAAVEGRLQGILGVVNRGNDPRKLVRRIPAEEMNIKLPEGATIVFRKASGRAVKGEPKELTPYFEIPIDLVDAGERLCPGSSHWENAYLWRLSYPLLPRLEEIRVAISYLQARLRLCTPSLDEYGAHLEADEMEALFRLTEQEQRDRYAASLEPLAKAPSADSLSLLAALVAESFITDQEVLLNLHKDYFHQGIEALLAHPLMLDVADELRDWVSNVILATAWEFPATYHVSSLAAPFVSMGRWEQITGEKGWISLFADASGMKLREPPWR